MKIKDLSNLYNGIDKHWIWRSPYHYNLANDCLQKLDYSIQDLNSEIENKNYKSLKDVVYCIALTDWIIESLNTVQKCLRLDVEKGFKYDKNSLVREATDYLKALRAFVIAHPLDTNKHGKYSLDGNFICVDFQTKPNALMKLISKNDRFYHLGINGMKPFDIVQNADDVILLSYSKKKDDMRFFTYIGINMTDIYSVSSKYIDKLYSLNKYLRGLRKKDYPKI